MAPQFSVHCSNIFNTWAGSLLECGGKIARVFSPYITNPLAERALQTPVAAAESVEVYTRFQIEAFVCGASSLKVLRRLIEKGHKVYHVPRLHAKVFEHPSNFATVGSQNLTQRGARNREANIIIRDPLHLRHLRVQLNRWTKDRREITLEMIAQAESLVDELQRTFRKIRKQCGEIEKRVLSAQDERDQDASLKNFLEDEAREKAARGLTLVAYQKARTDGLRRLGFGGEVPVEACRYILRYSMAWDTNGLVKQARGDADHIQPGPHGWELNLGGRSANRIAIGRAVERCAEELSRFFPSDSARWEGISHDDPFFDVLKGHMLDSVILQDNSLPGRTCQAVRGDRVKVGNHWLDATKAARYLLDWSRFNCLEDAVPGQ